MILGIDVRDRWNRLLETLRVAGRFRQDLAPHRGALVIVVLATLATVGLELLRPWPLKWIVDSALTNKHPSKFSAAEIIAVGSAAAIGIVILDSALDYLVAVIVTRVGQGVSRGLRHRVFEHLSHLSPSFHARNKSGDLLVRLMGDVPLVRTMLVDSSVAVATRAALVTGTVIAMFAVDVKLTLAVLALIPFLLLIVFWISRQITTAARRQRKAEGRLADYLHEAIAASPMIQTLGRESHVVERFAKSNRKAARTELKASILSARLSVSIETLFGATAAAALAYGSVRAVQGQISVGTLLVFLSYVRSLLKPMRATSKHSTRISKGTACAERILQILDEPIEIASSAARLPVPERPAVLAFENVSFAYLDTVEALRGFDVSIRRGELVGLFGRSGSGKSTVAALAVRLYDPERGRVTLDGVDLREYDLSPLRERFGLAMQESVLFGDTIRENLLLGRPDASEEELRAALRAAAADEFVAGLPAGLDTELGSGGVGLSGGERRRLCLARTLLRRSPILIVDEPFAGLDAIAVERVRRTLVEEARNAIVIVIAHDLDHLDAFDRIIFMNEGRVEDTGTHAELAGRSALYRRSTRALVEVTP